MPRALDAALHWDAPEQAGQAWLLGPPATPARTGSRGTSFLEAKPGSGRDLRMGVCDGVHGDRKIHVTVTQDNKRSLILDGKNTDGFVQSEVRCKGHVPMLLGSCDDQTIQRKWRCDELDFRKTLEGDAFPYVATMLRKIASRCRSKPVELLMLGLGGGTMQSYIAHECPDAKLTTIEASSAVIEAARRFFGFTGQAKVATAEQALRTLVQQKRHFDVIVADITDTVLTKEDVQNLHMLLKKDGLVLQNHTNYEKMSEQLGAFRDVFSRVEEETFAEGNVVVTSTDAPSQVEQALRQ